MVYQSSRDPASVSGRAGETLSSEVSEVQREFPTLTPPQIARAAADGQTRAMTAGDVLQDAPRANFQENGGGTLGWKSFALCGVDDGIRTRGLQGHNLAL